MSALRDGDPACTVQASVGTETDPAITILEARVKAMRALGVVKWADIELGPEPAPAGTSSEDETQRKDRLEAEQRRVARLRFGASGGPVPVGNNNR